MPHSARGSQAWRILRCRRSRRELLASAMESLRIARQPIRFGILDQRRFQLLQRAGCQHAIDCAVIADQSYVATAIAFNRP